MLNIRAVLVAELAGFAWFVAVLGIALIARRGRPFATPVAVRHAWVVLGIAELVGTASGAIAVWMNSSTITRSPSPVPLLMLQLVVLLVGQTALFSWASTFPVIRLVGRRVTKQVLPEPEVTFLPARWPRKIWTAGLLVVRTNLDSNQAIALLSQRLKNDFGYRSELRDPFDADAAGSGLTYLRPLPWKPKWPAAVFDATIQESSGGAVISGSLRLPWWPLVWCCLCVLGGAFVSIDGLNPASFIFPIFGVIVYAGGRFVSLPSAQASLQAWLGGRPIAPRAARPWSPRRKNIVLAITLGLEVLITGALFSWHSASVIADPTYLNNPLTAVFEVTFGIIFVTTLIANLAIWRGWRSGRRLGLFASALMALTCVGIILAFPQFIATMVATSDHSTGAAAVADAPPA